MTRWVTYLSLFDFEVNHVPAEKHKAPDGLSRRKRSSEDSEEEDADEYLDKIMGSAEAVKQDESTFHTLTASYRSRTIDTPEFATEDLDILYSAM